jgi:protein SCO1/2
MSRKSAWCAVVTLAIATACTARAREYELRGVIVAVDPARQEVTIKHEDIPQFMPGMTMPFKVRDAALLKGRVRGDLVRATLVVEESAAHLRTLERTGSTPVIEPAPAPLETVVETGNLVPDANFVDQDGKIRHLSEWRKYALAVTFIYTRCPIPDFCPLMDRHFKTAQATIQGDPVLRERARLLSVSFDPAHDRPPVLAAHARRLEADPRVWTFVSGDGVERFASQFGVSIIRDRATPEDVTHNLCTAVLDTSGRVSAILRGNEWTPPELIASLRTAIERR